VFFFATERDSFPVPAIADQFARIDLFYLVVINQYGSANCVAPTN
jgi:hypothetical protein